VTGKKWVWLHKNNIRKPCSDRNVLYPNSGGTVQFCMIITLEKTITLQWLMKLQLSQNRKFNFKISMIDNNKILAPLRGEINQ
jgi:hypothetical protein